MDFIQCSYSIIVSLITGTKVYCLDGGILVFKINNIKNSNDLLILYLIDMGIQNSRLKVDYAKNTVIF